MAVPLNFSVRQKRTLGGGRSEASELGTVQCTSGLSSQCCALGEADRLFQQSLLTCLLRFLYSACFFST